MRYASVTEAAHILAVSKMAVRQWCLQGKIKFLKIGDFLHVDLWNYLKDQGVDPKQVFDSLDHQRATRTGCHAIKERRVKKSKPTQVEVIHGSFGR